MTSPEEIEARVAARIEAMGPAEIKRAMARKIGVPQPQQAEDDTVRDARLTGHPREKKRRRGQRVDRMFR